MKKINYYVAAREGVIGSKGAPRSTQAQTRGRKQCWIILILHFLEKYTSKLQALKSKDYLHKISLMME